MQHFIRTPSQHSTSINRAQVAHFAPGIYSLHHSSQASFCTVMPIQPGYLKPPSYFTGMLGRQQQLIQRMQRTLFAAIAYSIVIHTHCFLWYYRSYQARVNEKCAKNRFKRILHAMSDLLQPVTVTVQRRKIMTSSASISQLKMDSQ